MKKPARTHIVTLEKIVGGGQSLGTLEDGRKAFVWGALPGETALITETKRKTNFIEGIATEIQTTSPERVEPLDPGSYLSTSPWQIMTFEAEQHYKAALVEEAFELHDIVLPDTIDMYSDGKTTHYRNKVEFSWYGERPEEAASEQSLQPEANETLDLAFFRRGSKGKISVDQFSLLPDSMMNLAREIRDHLAAKGVTARQLKTLLIRADQSGTCAWQLYVKDEDFDALSEDDAKSFTAQGGEVIYSDPRSPASRITKRLMSVGNPVLSDTILGVPFRYATEGFFQVNVPVYEQALRDMQGWVQSDDGSARTASAARESMGAEAPIDSRSEASEGEATERAIRPTIDLYSGVGSIGLTIGGENCTLIEIDENAIREMRRNIEELGSSATAVLAPAEKALDHINGDATIILDPPRAGLHIDVVNKLLETEPARIVYLSCNPVTQARDVALLAEKYGIRAHRGYNFFPRTPHIEHLVVLDRK